MLRSSTAEATNKHLDKRWESKEWRECYDVGVWEGLAVSTNNTWTEFKEQRSIKMHHKNIKNIKNNKKIERLELEFVLKKLKLLRKNGCEVTNT